jgi:hypothetical protein
LPEVVACAAEHIAHAGRVHVPVNQEMSRQMETHPAAEDRRRALLRVGMAERGASDRAEDDRSAFLSRRTRSEEADDNCDAEYPANHREAHTL